VEKNANTLIVSCPDDLGSMHADLTKVRQALFNLLSNASKFTDHGTITLTVRREADDWLTFAAHLLLARNALYHQPLQVACRAERTVHEPDLSRRERRPIAQQPERQQDAGEVIEELAGVLRSQLHGRPRTLKRADGVPLPRPRTGACCRLRVRPGRVRVRAGRMLHRRLTASITLRGPGGSPGPAFVRSVASSVSWS